MSEELHYEPEKTSEAWELLARLGIVERAGLQYNATCLEQREPLARLRAALGVPDGYIVQSIDPARRILFISPLPVGATPGASGVGAAGPQPDRPDAAGS